MTHKGTGQILAYMQTMLSPHRYAHCLAVADTAKQLAALYGADEGVAHFAGLTHDISKWMTPAQMLEFAKERNMPINPYEAHTPHLLHARISAQILREQFFVEDGRILSCVERHICGCPGMSKLEATVCLADWIEPGRQFADIPALRVLAQRSLEQALAKALATTIRVTMEREQIVYPLSLETYNYLRSLIERNERLT